MRYPAGLPQRDKAAPDFRLRHAGRYCHLPHARPASIKQRGNDRVVGRLEARLRCPEVDDSVQSPTPWPGRLKGSGEPTLGRQAQ
jgi:hypothetical protein